MDVTLVGGAGVAFIVVIYRLLTERSEIRDLRHDIQDLRTDFAVLKKNYDYQRHRAHLYREVITKMVGSVDLAAALTAEALTVLSDAEQVNGITAISKTLRPIATILAGLHTEVDLVLAETRKEPD